MQKYNKEYIIKLRKETIQSVKNNNLNKSHQIWLINDKKHQSGDNGEYFFRYLNHLKPNGIRFYFVINKNCSDYNRLKVYENIIDYNSSEYLKIFLLANKIILNLII